MIDGANILSDVCLVQYMDFDVNSISNVFMRNLWLIFDTRTKVCRNW